MKTLIQLENLLRSSKMSALDNLKAMECINILKELDVKYNGFGEDSFNFTSFFTKENEKNKDAELKYIQFVPESIEVYKEGLNCLIEISNSKKFMYISDKLLYLLYEVILDYTEYGDLSENTEYVKYDEIMTLSVRESNSEEEIVVYIDYNPNIIELLQSKGCEVKVGQTIVYALPRIELLELLYSLVNKYLMQVEVGFPGMKKLEVSENLAKTLSNSKYKRLSGYVRKK